MFSYVSAIQHMQDFSKGLIDSRPIIWYLSMTVLICYLTLQVFNTESGRLDPASRLTFFAFSYGYPPLLYQRRKS